MTAPRHQKDAAFFVSDVHLGLADRETERAKEDRLIRFLDHARDSAESLFIVGDLFDFWFEYRSVVPRGFHRTLTALEHFTAEGIPVHHLAGNHDFWAGDFFRNELGITVHTEPFETRVQDKRILLHHGDGLAEHDLGYRLIKPILRARLSVTLYRWLHPDLGVKLAHGSSRASRQYTSNKHYGEGTGMARYAEQRIQQGVDIVVMGHRHVPELRAIGTGVYVNLGDWITHNTYGVMRGGQMRLETWNL